MRRFPALLAALAALAAVLIGGGPAIATASASVPPSTFLQAEQQPPIAPANVDAWDLLKAKYAVRHLSTVRMWDCWSLTAGSRPALQARVQGRWVLVTRATVTGDRARCGKDLKATYTWTVKWAGTWSATKRMYLLRVREVAGAEKIPWNVVVRPAASSPAAAPTYHGVTPGAFCGDHYALGLTSTGELMQCKTSATDSRFRWRAH